MLTSTTGTWAWRRPAPWLVLKPAPYSDFQNSFPSALNRGGRPLPTSLDVVLDGLFYRLHNAGPWGDLPRCFGPWRTIYGWYRWRGLAVNLLLVEGQACEGHHVLPLLPQPSGLCVVGDKGFDSDKLRQQLRALGATA